MKLEIKDRLSLVELLPRKGDIMTLTISEDIRKKVAPSQAEFKEINWRSEGGGAVYDPSKDPKKDISFTEAEIKLLKQGVTEADKQKSISADMLSTCLMIQSYDSKAAKKCNRKK